MCSRGTGKIEGYFRILSVTAQLKNPGMNLSFGTAKSQGTHYPQDSDVLAFNLVPYCRTSSSCGLHWWKKNSSVSRPGFLTPLSSRQSKMGLWFMPIPT